MIGQIRSHENNRRRVSDNNNISQLLRDSFSVSQQPPIWEPPSNYSMPLPQLSMIWTTATKILLTHCCCAAHTPTQSCRQAHNNATVCISRQLGDNCLFVTWYDCRLQACCYPTIFLLTDGHDMNTTRDGIYTTPTSIYLPWLWCVLHHVCAAAADNQKVQFEQEPK